MNKQEILKQLDHVKKEANTIDPLISEQLEAISDRLSNLSENDFSETDQLDVAISKEANLFNPGCRVVCTNPVSPLYKGRIYIVSDNSIPGFVMIKEETGEDVGIFEVNRFLLDWKAY